MKYSNFIISTSISISIHLPKSLPPVSSLYFLFYCLVWIFMIVLWWIWWYGDRYDDMTLMESYFIGHIFKKYFLLVEVMWFTILLVMLCHAHNYTTPITSVHISFPKIITPFLSMSFQLNSVDQFFQYADFGHLVLPCCVSLNFTYYRVILYIFPSVSQHDIF